MLTAATLGYCLFVRGGAELFRDSDTGWHIRNGESILESRALPRTDPFSFSKAGEPWIAWEWGSDVLLGFAHRAAGLPGVAAVTAVAISACAWMWVRLSFAAGGDFFLTALLAPIFTTTASLHWLARPHVFGWIFLLGALLYLETVDRVGWLSLAGVAVVSAVWTNVHGSFFFGPGLAAAYAIGARKAKFIAIAVAAIVGTFANPYGWRLHEHIFAYLRDTGLTSRIAEFQSFNFHDPNATQVALAMAIGGAGTVLALTQRKYSHFLIGAVIWFGALRSARVIPLVALAVLPFANGAIAQELGRIGGLKKLLKYSGGLRTIDARVNGSIFAVVTMGLMLIALRAPVMAQQIGFSDSLYPVHAADAIAGLPQTARIMAPDHYGGYLIYRFRGARKVFFDGRSDFYGAAFMDDYFRLSTVRPGWHELMKKYAFTHALLPKDSALGDALEHDGWRKISEDRVAILLEGR
jgi:hypothetical protein